MQMYIIFNNLQRKIEEMFIKNFVLFLCYCIYTFQSIGGLNKQKLCD